MKYIVIRVTDDGLKREYPIVFPEEFVHASVAEMHIRFMLLTKPKGIKRRTVTTVSAGFFSSMDLSCCQPYGESKSIGVVSRDDKDRELFAMLDYTHGIVP